MDALFNVTLMGEPKTGKSAFAQICYESEFNQEYLPTVGVDFKSLMLDLQLYCKDYKIKAVLWDCAGEKRFQVITSAYLRGSQVVILFYDITDRNTFDALEKNWVDLIKNNCNLSRTMFVLLGNKDDMK